MAITAVSSPGATAAAPGGPNTNADVSLPGGGVEQVFDRRNIDIQPDHVRQHHLAASSPEYKRRAFEDGIPFRPHGLFPPADPLLRRLAADPQLHAFEKHLPGEESPYELLPKGGWTTGDTAASRGLDLRLFYREPEAGQALGTIEGAVRFGDGACIGDGFFMSAHGGAIESALDEATAELAKLEFVPIVSTREATFGITKPVPLHTSLSVICRIKELRGIRCYVEGAITSADGAVRYATCSALLVNIRDFI